MMIKKYPKDKYGKEYQPGSLFIENAPYDEIQEGKAIILTTPIGLFTGEHVEYPAFGEWVVETYIKGMVQYKDGEENGPLYISRWDGEYVGDWEEETIIIGHIEDMNKKFKNWCITKKKIQN